MQNIYDGLIIDLTGETARFALCQSGRLVQVREYLSKDFTTATDCVINYAREVDISLNGLQTVTAVSGVIKEEAIRVARCPWIISKRGIGYLTNKPAYYINDSSARLLASQYATKNQITNVIGYDNVDFDKESQFSIVNFSKGLGAAVFSNDVFGNKSIRPTEMGHASFSPVTENEEKLYNYLRKNNQLVSWETALTADMVAVSNATDMSGIDIQKTQLGILGSFTGELILSTGSWDGVFLVDNASRMLTQTSNIPEFKSRIAMKANFQVELRQVPCWRFDMKNMNLFGGMRYLEMCKEHLTE